MYFVNPTVSSSLFNKQDFFLGREERRPNFKDKAPPKEKSGHLLVMYVVSASRCYFYPLRMHHHLGKFFSVVSRKASICETMAARNSAVVTAASLLSLRYDRTILFLSLRLGKKSSRGCQCYKRLLKIAESTENSLVQT